MSRCWPRHTPLFRLLAIVIITYRYLVQAAHISQSPTDGALAVNEELSRTVAIKDRSRQGPQPQRTVAIKDTEIQVNHQSSLQVGVREGGGSAHCFLTPCVTSQLSKGPCAVDTADRFEETQCVSVFGVGNTLYAALSSETVLVQCRVRQTPALRGSQFQKISFPSV